MSKGKFRIQTVAEMTGVPASTLRTWEQRYGFPSPDRTASAYRMYSQDDIDRIGKVRELCERGLGPAEAVKQVFDAGELPPATAAEPTAEPLRVLPGDAATLVDALQGAIEGFEPERVESLVRSALLVGSHAEAFEQWVWPAWRRVRERWLAGSLALIAHDAMRSLSLKLIA